MTSELPRRAFLGAILAPDSEAFSSGGAKIVGALDGSMAAQADLQKDDRLLLLSGCPLNSLCELGEAVRRAGAQVSAELIYERAGQRESRVLAVQRCPEEVLSEQQIWYEQIDVPGARLRSIVTTPKGGPPRGAILLLQGIACESVDYGAQADEPLARLVHGWAQAGYMTMRVDKRGVGDSEGSCTNLDFHTEVADCAAALDALAGDARRQGAPIRLFGHSVGGMVAPLLAANQSVRDIMVYGTSTKNWLQCVVDSTRRQLLMRGDAPDQVDRHLASLVDRVRSEGLNGRCAAYHQQLDTLDLRGAWTSVLDTRVLVLCGEYDWVLGRTEQMKIAEIVPGAQLAELPGLDHMLGWHPSREASQSAYGQGRFADEILAHTLSWLAAGPTD